MRITYDRQSHPLNVVLKEGVAVAESDGGKPGVSRRVTEAGRVEYQSTGWV